MYLITKYQIVFYICLIVRCLSALYNTMNISYSIVVDRISIPLSFSLPKSFTFYTSIDLMEKHSYFNQIQNKSRFISNSTIIFEDKEIEVTNRRTMIYFIDYDLDWFTSFPIENIRYGLNKGVAFGYELNSNYSFVKQLQAQDKISQPVFSIHPIFPSNGSIYIGEIPHSIIENKYETSCYVNDTKQKWGCTLNNIIIEHSNGSVSTVEINDYAYFQSSGGFIVAPSSFILYINDTLFKEYLENKECQFSYSSFSFRNYQCDSKVVNAFKSFIFVIGDTKFKLGKEEMFDIYRDNFCRFKIHRDDTYNNEEKWIFGNEFILQYITKYDYEKKKITFYSDTPFEKTNETIKKAVLVINIIVIIGLVNVIYNKLHKHSI